MTTTNKLTRAEVEALTPEQLRLKVAERIFGWKWETWTNGIFLCHPETGVTGARKINGGVRLVSALPDYASDIAAAWTVHKKMARSEKLDVANAYLSELKKIVCAREPDVTVKDWVQALAYFEPEDVSRAALLAESERAT